MCAVEQLYHTLEFSKFENESKDDAGPLSYSREKISSIYK